MLCEPAHERPQLRLVGRRHVQALRRGIRAAYGRDDPPGDGDRDRGAGDRDEPGPVPMTQREGGKGGDGGQGEDVDAEQERERERRAQRCLHRPPKISSFDRASRPKEPATSVAESWSRWTALHNFGRLWATLEDPAAPRADGQLRATSPLRSTTCSRS